MPLRREMRLRQPGRSDPVGRRFTVAGVGSGFEGTIVVRVVDARGRELATTSAQSSGGGTLHGEFSTEVEVAHPPRAGTPVTVQVFGDNPGLPDEGPYPGFDLREVEVVMYPDLRGWLVYRVEPGDTLTGIARRFRDFGRTTPAQIAAANARITDPDEIQAGWRIRIPLSD